MDNVASQGRIRSYAIGFIEPGPFNVEHKLKCKIPLSLQQIAGMNS